MDAHDASVEGAAIDFTEHRIDWGAIVRHKDQTAAKNSS